MLGYTRAHMEVCTGKPAAALQQFVRYYAQIKDHFPAQAFFHPVPARSTIVLDFTFGDPCEAWFGNQSWHEPAHAVALIGAQTYRRVDLEMRGHMEEFVIVFQPGGLPALFRLPPEELTNRHFDGRAVFGHSIEELRCQLGEAQSFAERVRVADKYLLTRTARSLQGSVIAAARALHHHRGCLRISQLAEKAGLSLRQFERRFISEIGMSPKLYARVARFEAALEARKRGPGLRWVDIAHNLGYHDQMHMVHDFRQLSGSTPSDIAPRMDIFVVPEIASR